MSRIGYIRVSTEHQETARQQEIMCGYQVDRIFSEKISGANKDRPQLKAMLNYVRGGIEIAKAQGKYTGRKPIEIDWTRFGQLYGEWKSKSITGRDFMRRMGLYGTDHGCANRLRASSTHQYCALTKS